MTDREKVIKEFEDFVKSFSKRDDTYYKGLFVSVLSLLKEREPVKPKEVKLWYTEYACGYCDYKSVGRKDGYKMRFCPCCGREVKWDD